MRGVSVLSRRTFRSVLETLLLVLFLVFFSGLEAAADQSSPQGGDQQQADENESKGTAQSEIMGSSESDFDPVGTDPDEDSPGTDEGSLWQSVEEMVITSQGRAQPLQDMGASVAAFDSEYLDALGAQSIADISQFTPNLEIRSVFSASNPTLFIRGVGLRDFNANSASSVAVYNDDVYMNSPAGQLAQLFDVQQVEVLRGPQGSLYGRNASAGAIRIIARKPTGATNASAKVSYGKFNEVDIEAAVETSIIPDLLSVRLAGVMRRRDGTTFNRCGSEGAWANANFLDRDSMSYSTFTNCFNATTTKPYSLGGQNWDTGVLDPVICNPYTPRLPDGTCPSYGLLNATGARALQLQQGRTAGELATQPTDVERWVNNRDNFAARAIFRYTPSLDMDWQLNIHGGQSSGLSRQFQMIARNASATGLQTVSSIDSDGYSDPDMNVIFAQNFRPDGSVIRNSVRGALRPEYGNAFAGDYNNTGPELLDLAGTSLVGEITSGNFMTRTVTAFEWNRRFVDANLDGSPFISTEVGLSNDAWQLSEEVRVFWDAGGDFTFQFGGYFLSERLSVSNEFRFSTFFGTSQDYTQDSLAGSIYGFMTWQWSEAFSIDVGLRGNIDHKELSLTTQSFQIRPDPAVPDGLGPPVREQGELVSGGGSVTKGAPTGDLTFNYKPTEEILTYLKYSRGWKGPHINGGAIGTSGRESLDSLIVPVKPESVDALEFGFKTTLWDGRARLNGALFYYDYANIQIFQLKNVDGGAPVQELINAEDADLYGLEAELNIRPLEGFVPESLEELDLFFTFGWLDSAYSDFVNTLIRFEEAGPVPYVQNYTGNELINAPKFSFAGYARWRFPLGSGGSVTPRFDWTYKSRVYFSPVNGEGVSQPAFWLLNLRVDYAPPGDKFDVAFWVRNVANKTYSLDVINLAELRGSILYAIGDPRTFGVTVSYRF